jgi:hypothetical protein
LKQIFNEQIRHKLSFIYKKIVGMHSIKNISERNKMDTQSRADAYNRRKSISIRVSEAVSLFPITIVVLEWEAVQRSLRNEQKCT